MKKFLLLLLLTNCTRVQTTQTETSSLATDSVKPVVVTEAVRFDSDDPAIWINPLDSAGSLILGTDKDENGGLYVFDLNGKIINEKVVSGLKRPNNVDVEYGLLLNGKPTDIAVVTERMTHKLRVFSLPDLKPIDHGGLEVFQGDTTAGFQDLMGISLYRNPKSEKVYAIVGRKSGPAEGYLGQYLLEDDGQGQVKATLVRKFGKFSGTKEIESIAVDDELGYVYYSDEGVGVRKYFADAEKGNEELAVFGTSQFTQDHEGISIYSIRDGTGYILVSDQQSNRFHIFTREGTKLNPHDHQLVKTVNTSTMESDGSEITSVSLPGKFRSGLFVGMSTDKTFQYYRWEDIAGHDLIIAPNGKPSADHTDSTGK